MLQALTDKSQENVEGVARLRLYKGSARFVGRKSPRNLYSPASATPKASSNLTPRLHLAACRDRATC
jgi:argininosuccinate synthase